MYSNRLLIFSLLLTLFTSCDTKQVPLPELTYTDGDLRIQHPLSPEDSKRHIQVPEGFELTLFAAEPNIVNPIAFSWDEKGRLWVVQSQDYPHGLGNDVGGDRITICEDTDGDGKADKFIDFATAQNLSTGITVVKGGAIVAQAPNMMFLEDTDGDDKMDKSTVLFDGFGTWDTHAGPSSLRYGLDNKIWGAVGYSGFENIFEGKSVSFKMGVFNFGKDGNSFEPIGQFNNNTWGLGFNENFEIFGSTANNNHACYVGIPLRYYEYLEKRPKWALNADFIQGHYEISPVDTIPLQQVDVRGGYTAAAGANFYTARNYPQQYWNQMYVNEPTGHLVHLSKIVKEGAGYKEVDGGNIFASTDAWTAPVFTETGPDGNLWVADWYNPVIQHNPDKRGMENQIWNDEKGEGNAHINEHRDKRHGRIYIIKHEDGNEVDIKSLNAKDEEGLIQALQSDNMFWRTTAQRIIVEEKLSSLVPQLLELVVDSHKDASGFNGTALHALWTLDGLGAFESDQKARDVLSKALNNDSYAVKRAALELLPITEDGAEQLMVSGLLDSEDLLIRSRAILKAGELPEIPSLYEAMESLSKDDIIHTDKWLNAAFKVYHREKNFEYVKAENVQIIVPSSAEGNAIWKYTQTVPSENWIRADFEDAAWKSGKAKFGGKEVLKNTLWEKEDIWLRREIVINGDIAEPVLKIAHDDDYEVYINGHLLLAEAGASGEYKYIKLDKDKGKLFKKGKNLLAVHCHDNGGQRYIDVGIGIELRPSPDVSFTLKTVSQKMAYDKTVLEATAGQMVEIVLENTDEMPHNLVVLEKGSLATFGKMVDGFLKNPEAAKMGYVPNSRNVIGATPMLEPGEKASILFKLPNRPGRYPFVCTFPGHWRLMQGVIIVNAPGTYLSDDKDAPNIAMMSGGGSSHNFVRVFGIMDGKVLSSEGKNSVVYTENPKELEQNLQDAQVLHISNNKPIGESTRNAIFAQVNKGMSMLICHPSTWYNWEDWPQYNKQLVGGGSRSHEKLQEFEVLVTRPDHPIMKGVPARFRIFDELYRWEKDPGGTPIEVLAIGKSLETGDEFPVVWVVKHPKAKIVGNTLGHDERAHRTAPYKRLLKNSVQWALKK